MNFIKIHFYTGDIEVFVFNLIKGNDSGRLCIFNDMLQLTAIDWSDIYKVEIYRQEVE